MLFGRILHRAARMCELAYRIQKLSVVLSCPLLAGSAALFLRCGGRLSVHTYRVYAAATELLRLPSAILLVGVLAAVCVEELAAERS